jgi:hypothetical protein
MKVLREQYHSGQGGLDVSQNIKAGGEVTFLKST